MVAVVVGVTHSVRGHVQLREGDQRDSGLMDGVDEAASRRDRHRVDQLLRAPGRVRRQQDVGVQDDTLALRQTHRLTLQHQVTCRTPQGGGQNTFMVSEEVKHFFYLLVICQKKSGNFISMS